MNAGCGFGVLLLYRDPAVLPALSLVSQQSCGGGLIAEDLKRAVLLEQVTERWPSRPNKSRSALIS